MSEHRGWYSREYLPHFDQPGLVQALTFRLADALPKEVLSRWKAELEAWPEEQRRDESTQRIETWLDAGHGACHLRDTRVAALTEDALLHFDGQRYQLLAWVIMPNHVHTLIETLEGFPLGEVVQSWKTWTARRANAVLGREGNFWQRDFHDRFIRDADHLSRVRRYIEHNPVKAKLCSKPEDWRWSSASKER